MKKAVHEFREFIIRGNVIDLAIGIIIGSAFGTVVNSVVNNLLMPPLGLLISNVDFQDLFFTLREGTEPLKSGATLQMAQEAGAVTFNYGQFITDLLSFMILGISVFLLIKGIRKLETRVDSQKENEKPEEDQPDEKECSYCLMTIAKNAIRCPHCTSELKLHEAEVGQ